MGANLQGMSGPAIWNSKFQAAVSYPQATSQGAQICQINVNRYALLLDFVTTGGDCFVAPLAIPQANSGLVLGAGRPPLLLTYAQHGGLVQEAWYAVSSGPQAVTVIEGLWLVGT